MSKSDLPDVQRSGRGTGVVPGRLLTTRQLAERLGLSTESVLRRWRRDEWRNRFA